MVPWMKAGLSTQHLKQHTKKGDRIKCVELAGNERRLRAGGFS